MITQIDLEYFKCFELLKLSLNKLTLLSGSNAAGKSSVLQAIVLLHQNMCEHEWSTRLVLNGKSVRLGSASDVIDQIHGRRNFYISLNDNNTSIKWDFTGERNELSMKVDCVSIGSDIYRKPKLLRHLLPPKDDKFVIPLINHLKRLTYLTAERIGPREVYPLEDPENNAVVGPMGENAASILYTGRDEQVLGKLVLAGTPPTRFHQIKERMRSFFPGYDFEVQQVPNANQVTLGQRTSDDTDFNRPIHAGFGLTQVLPIIVAALSMKEDDIFLIENPEVHLHPSGQALMGQFLSEIAHAGIQVIIETHSDHVLNGIRRAVKTKIIDENHVSIHFFNRRCADEAQVISPILDSVGNLDFWPEGFFDQFDKDSNYFAEWDK